MKYKTYYSKKEDFFWNNLRKVKDPMFLPIIYPLSKLNIDPKYISYAGVIFSVLALFFYYDNFLLVFFGVLMFLSDGIDGAYARYTKKDSTKGAYLDIYCDLITFVIFSTALILKNLIPVDWGLIHIFEYLSLMIFSLILNKIKKPYKFIFRTKHWIYLFAAIKLGWTIDMATPLIIITCIYYAPYIIKGSSVIKDYYLKK